MSLTSFDARTKPCPTHIPGLHLCLYLTACSLYNIINGFQLGQNVQKIDTEVQPSYMLELMETSLVSFSMGTIFVTRKTENRSFLCKIIFDFRGEYLSVISIFCWMISASSFHLVGGIVGVSLRTHLFCIKTLLVISECCAVFLKIS